MGKISKITPESVYVTVFSEAPVTNEEGWTKNLPTDRTPPLCGNQLIDFASSLIRRYKTCDTDFIAVRLGVDKEEMNAATRLFTGMNMREFATRYLLLEACELLRFTKLPVREVARRVSMGSALNFTNIFRTAMKMPPATWRRLNANPQDWGKYKL